MTHVLVIGAGVGAAIAAELSSHGIPVTLVDESPRVLAGASGRHGRRLHLGEHYSGDADFAPGRLNTGQTCLLGALSLVDRWPQVASGPGRWWQFIVVGSMTSPDEYHAYLAELRRFHAELQERGLDPHARFGAADERHRTLAQHEYAHLVNAALVTTAVESREPVIDAAVLHGALSSALHEADAEVLLSHRVVSLRGGEGGFVVTAETPDGVRELTATHVVNAAWHGLGALTASLAAPPLPAAARLRVMAEVTLPVALREAPSMYFHRGVFGNHTNIGRGRALLLAEDVSNLATGNAAAIPSAWRAFVAAGAGDETWPQLLRQLGRHDPASVSETAGRLARAIADRDRDATWIRAELSRAITRTYARWVPQLADAEVTRLIPNVVVSAGDANLGDPASAVHRRDAIVREPCAGYVEVLTGKLTYFVLVAEEVAARVLARVRGARLSEVRDATMAPVVRVAWPDGAGVA